MEERTTRSIRSRFPIEQKADLLLKANAEAMKASNVKFVFSELGLLFVKDERNYASTRRTRSSRRRSSAAAAPIADHGGRRRTSVGLPESRPTSSPPMGRGWEYVLEQDLVGNAAKWGEEASQKLKAKPVEVGRYDLVLHPSHLWLTIHESIAHPTELDRAMGYEANYAGTSFVAPPTQCSASSSTVPSS